MFQMNLRKLIFYCFGVVTLFQLPYFKSFIFSKMFCLLILTITERFLLKFISTSFSVSSCFTYFEAVLIDAYTFTTFKIFLKN